MQILMMIYSKFVMTLFFSIFFISSAVPSKKNYVQSASEKIHIEFFTFTTCEIHYLFYSIRNCLAVSSMDCRYRSDLESDSSSNFELSKFHLSSVNQNINGNKLWTSFHDIIYAAKETDICLKQQTFWFSLTEI